MSAISNNSNISSFRPYATPIQQAENSITNKELLSIAAIALSFLGTGLMLASAAFFASGSYIPFAALAIKGSIIFAIDAVAIYALLK